MKLFYTLVLFFITIHNSYAIYTWTANTTHTILISGQKVRLQNGQYDLALQANGECGIYKLGVKPLYTFSSSGSEASFLYFQADGNLELYNTSNLLLWNSGTEGNPGAKLTFYDNGNLEIKSAGGFVLWASNTATGGTVPVSNYQNYNVTSGLSSAQIITPQYATDDIVIADYNIMDYGVDNTGIIDATTIIQQRVNTCYNNGGGTIWFPKGRYRIRSTITIPSGVIIRGDWNNPDNSASFSNVNDYGTTFLVDFKGIISGAVFFLRGINCGLYGLTFYYPHQNAYKPVEYDYTIKCQGYSAITLKNITLLNSYKGIQTTSTHQTYLFKNIKATCLKQAIRDVDAADVSVYQDVTINNQYWASATHDLNPPSISILNDWTRNNGIGIELLGLEWQQVDRVFISNYNVGLITGSVYRNTSPTTGYFTRFSGSLIQLNIDNCNTGVLLDSYDTRFPPIFTNCYIAGSVYSVKNNYPPPNPNPPAYALNQFVIFNYCTISGPTDGSQLSFINSPSPAPPLSTQLLFNAIPRTTRAVLYNVALAPYNAARVLGNAKGSLPTINVTTVIQTALNDAGTAGGGVVYLPAGWYRIDGVLNVPANVVLMGANSLPIDDHVTAYLPTGTSLYGFNGHNTSMPDIETAMISLNGNNAGVSGLRIFLAARDFSDSIDYKYPYVIRGNGSSNYVTNCALQDVYNGIDFSTNLCTNFHLSSIHGGCTNNLIKVNGIGTGNIMNVIINPARINTVGHLNVVHNFNWNNFSPVLAITRANLVMIKVEESTIGYGITTISNTFQYGGNTNVINYNPNTIVYNTGLDNIGPGGYVLKSYSDMKVINILSYNPLTLSTPVYPVILNIAPNGNIKFWSWSDIF